MKMVLKMAVFTVVAAFLCSCGGKDVDPTYEYIEYCYIINESAHQIYMSDIYSGLFPESINLGPADSATDGANMWSSVTEGRSVAYIFYPPLSMTITIDGIYSYTVYEYPNSSHCQCGGGSCKCGENAEEGCDAVCMCKDDVINLCDSSNWTLVSVNGMEQTDNVIRFNLGEENTIVWTFTITEEMVEQTLSLLAEE
ncbi:MAG: hypothetical protein LUD72_02370 [Bacteroidales bacterium]|nr:hypothetical protein [Bacteroidales bacterium]